MPHHGGNRPEYGCCSADFPPRKIWAGKSTPARAAVTRHQGADRAGVTVNPRQQLVVLDEPASGYDISVAQIHRGERDLGRFVC